MEKSSTRRVTIYINGKEVESSPSFPLFARSCFAQHARSRHLRTRNLCRAHIRTRHPSWGLSSLATDMHPLTGILDHTL